MWCWFRVVFLAAAAGAAWAQVAEFGVHGGVSQLKGRDVGSYTVTDGGSVSTFRVSLTEGWRLGFRVTLNNWPHFGHEFGYAYNRTHLRFEGTGLAAEEFGMAIHQGFYNFLAYATPEGSKIRPFGAGGGHFSNFVPPGTSVTSGGGSVKFGFNYGGGVKIKVHPYFNIRFDFRQYVTGKPFELRGRSGSMRQNEFSTGFALIL